MLNEAHAAPIDDWRIAMLARNNGFPLAKGSDDFGFAFSGPSLHSKAISIRRLDGAVLAMRVPAAVASEMRAQSAAGESDFSVDENDHVIFADISDLAGRTIRRAAALIRALPDTPLVIYRQKTATMPAATEAERLVKMRIGQDVFRSALDDYWQGRCAVTGISDRALLRASHIKGWAECDSDEERLDVFNGLLLAAHLDAAFDARLITFGDDGAMIFSPKLTPQARVLLGDAHGPVHLTDGHRKFLRHHRQKFEQASA